ncbi:MAG: hypothetical protein Q7S28_03055 [bacterium]|nr:hypothetical protein [bacterium]
MKRSRTILIIVLVLAVLGVIAFGILGSYPIASVNSKLILARELGTMYRASMAYQNNLIAFYNAQNGSTTLQAPPDAEVERSVLNQLIESRLVRAELERAQDPEVLKTLIEGKFDQYKASDFEKQATVFGLTLNDYKDLILVPQAEHDILWNSLFVQGKDANAWLTEAKQGANVTLFSLKWKWDGKEAVAR